MSPSMSRVRSVRGLMLVASFLLTLGCKESPKEPAAAAAPAEDPAAVHPEIWPQPKWPLWWRRRGMPRC